MSDKAWETVDIKARMNGGVVSMTWTETTKHEQLIPVVDLEQLPHFAAIIAERDELREALTTLFAKCRLNDSEAIAIVVVADAMGSCEKEIDLTFVVDALKEGRGD